MMSSMLNPPRSISGSSTGSAGGKLLFLVCCAYSLSMSSSSSSSEHDNISYSYSDYSSLELSSRQFLWFCSLIYFSISSYFSSKPLNWLCLPSPICFLFFWSTSTSSKLSYSLSWSAISWGPMSLGVSSSVMNYYDSMTGSFSIVFSICCSSWPSFSALFSLFDLKDLWVDGIDIFDFLSAFLMDRSCYTGCGVERRFMFALSKTAGGFEISFGWLLCPNFYITFSLFPLGLEKLANSTNLLSMPVPLGRRLVPISSFGMIIYSGTGVVYPLFET